LIRQRRRRFRSFWKTKTTRSPRKLSRCRDSFHQPNVSSRLPQKGPARPPDGWARKQQMTASDGMVQQNSFAHWIWTVGVLVLRKCCRNAAIYAIRMLLNPAGRGSRVWRDGPRTAGTSLSKVYIYNEDHGTMSFQSCPSFLRLRPLALPACTLFVEPRRNTERSSRGASKCSVEEHNQAAFVTFRFIATTERARSGLRTE
jgi:hypothetical protein